MSSKKPRKRRPERPKPTSVRLTSEILANARETLQHVRDSLDDFLDDDPRRSKAGLRNFIINARSVTFVLQTLKNTAPGAAEWYEDVRARLKADTVADAFATLRNQVEKEGILKVGNAPRRLYITHFNSTESVRGIVPSGMGYVLGDRSGANHWIDQTGRRHYFLLPGVHSVGGTRFEDAPDPLLTASVDELAHYYLEVLERIVVEAMLKFSYLP